jgi:hypothetical protein
VVALGDEELFEFFVDETALEARLYRLGPDELRRRRDPR